MNAGQLVSKNAEAGDRTNVATVVVGNQEFAVAQQVNLPSLKHDSGETVTILILAAIVDETKTEKKVIKVKGVDTEVEEEKTLHIAKVGEITTGLDFTYVMNAITNDNLRRMYPNDGYVGRTFAIQKLGLVAGKRYKDVNILELTPTGVTVDSQTGEVTEGDE